MWEQHNKTNAADAKSRAADLSRCVNLNDYQELIYITYFDLYKPNDPIH